MDTSAPTQPAASLTRLTVLLTDRAHGALNRAAELTGDTPTDIVNRALLTYALVHDVAARGEGSVWIDDIMLGVRNSPAPTQPVDTTRGRRRFQLLGWLVTVTRESWRTR